MALTTIPLLFAPLIHGTEAAQEPTVYKSAPARVKTTEKAIEEKTAAQPAQNGNGRCDVRMNEQGELFILEINPNPAIMLKPEEYGPADYMILYDKDGHKGFFGRVFRSALIRHKMRSGVG